MLFFASLQGKPFEADVQMPLRTSMQLTTGQSCRMEEQVAGRGARFVPNGTEVGKIIAFFADLIGLYVQHRCGTSGRSNPR